MKNINYLILVLFVVSLGLTSCEKDTIDTSGKYDNGIFVVNEGNWGQGNASLSFIDKDFSGVENEVFYKTNEKHLGDVAQSINFSGDYAYIVVNASNTVEVAKRADMEFVVTIANGLFNPRYFETVNDSKALVTCWGDPDDPEDDYLAVIDTRNNVVTDKISVELGPEKMVKNDEYLFIAHRGARSTNHKVTVYDLVLDEIKQVINVGDRPNSMVIKDQYLWVLCGGEPSWTGDETAGQLYKIDINNNFNIDTIYNFDVSEHPDLLNLDGDNLYYYLNGNVYKMNVNDAALPSTAFFTYESDYYGAYNMETYNGKLYLTDPKDYVQEGEVIVFDLSNGNEISRKTVGIIPGDLGFNVIDE